jgi:hypothetical protein
LRAAVRELSRASGQQLNVALAAIVGRTSTMPSRALAEQLAILRAHADAYRSQAIALDAKLRLLAPMRRDLIAVRERLHAMSARLDGAIWSLVRLGQGPHRRARGTTKR